MNVLHTRPQARVARRRGKTRAQILSPLGLVPRIKGVGIKGSQRVAAYALIVFEDEAHVWFEGQVGADENTTQSVRVLSEKRLAVLAMISRLEADIVSARLVARSGGTNNAVFIA